MLRRGPCVALPAWIRACGPAVVVLGWGAGAAAAVRAGGCRLLWRGGGEHGQGFALPSSGLRREPGGGAAGVVGLADVPGVEDALVADGEQAGEPQREGGQARESAPAAGDGGGGGVLDGGEGPLGAGAAGVGAAVRWGGVVVFLPGLCRDLGRDGDGLLRAAGGRVLRRGEDLGPAAVQRH